MGLAGAEMILALLPAHITVVPQIGRIAVGQLDRMGERPTAHMLDILASLDRPGLGPVPDRYAGLLESDRDVTAFVEATGTERFRTDARYFGGIVARLDRASPAVLELRLEPVLQACLECDHPDLGAKLLGLLEARKLRRSLAGLMIELWRKELGGPGHVRAVIWGVGCLMSPKLPARRRDQIVDALHDFRATLSPAEQKKWYQDLRGYLPRTQHETWAEIAGPESKPRRSLWISRDGGR